MTGSRGARSLGALLGLGLIGIVVPSLACDCAGPTETGSGSGSTARSGSEAGTGTIVGIVRLAEGAALPEYPQSPTQIPGRPALPESCTPPRQDDRTPVRPSEETGGLINISIAITGEDESRWPRAGEPQVRELRIHDCRLTPLTLVATVGDRLRFVNEDPGNPFFVDLGDGMVQYRTEPREVPLDQGGVRTIECGFAAPCGRAELITLYHPIHGVSGADGRFRIENVPADQPVRVTAWHPLFVEGFAMATVGAGETAEVEITIRPHIVVAPPPPEAGHEGPAELHPDPNAPF